MRTIWRAMAGCGLAIGLSLVASWPGLAGAAAPQDDLRDGFEALEEGRFVDAESAYRRALVHARGEEQLFHANVGLGSALMGQKRPVEAAEAFAASERHRPGSPEALRLWSGALLATGDRVGAEAVLERLILLPSADAGDFHELGVLLAVDGRHEEAARVFSAGALRYPKDAALRIGFAVALYHQSRFERALAVFDAVLELDPTNARAVFGRAMALLALGDRGAAEAAYEELRTRDIELADELARELNDAG